MLREDQLRQQIITQRGESGEKMLYAIVGLGYVSIRDTAIPRGKQYESLGELRLTLVNPLLALHIISAVLVECNTGDFSYYKRT